MDTNITLCFDSEVAERAKAFAEAHHLSLSRLTELIYRRMTAGKYTNLEEFPISDWVHAVAEGEPVYQRERGRKAMKSEFLSSRK